MTTERHQDDSKPATPASDRDDHKVPASPPVREEYPGPQETSTGERIDPGTSDQPDALSVQEDESPDEDDELDDEDLDDEDLDDESDDDEEDDEEEDVDEQTDPKSEPRKPV
jgi:hypothetical protein